MWWELQLGIFQQATDNISSSVGALKYLHSNSSLSLSLHVTYDQFVKYIELAPFPSEWASQECNWVSSRLTWLNTWCQVHPDWLIGVTWHTYISNNQRTQKYSAENLLAHILTRSPIDHRPGQKLSLSVSSQPLNLWTIVDSFCPVQRGLWLSWLFKDTARERQGMPGLQGWQK